MLLERIVEKWKGVKDMNTQSLMYGIGGLVIGAVLMFIGTMNESKTTSAPVHNAGMTMEDMVNALKGKTGDDFDKAFISGMIEHHQGAIDMASLAKTNAMHDEIKKMADDIISAQTNEIEMMRQWQKTWGY